MVLMPTEPSKDKGPTVGEFVLFWVIVAGIAIFLGWYKGHLVI